MTTHTKVENNAEKLDRLICDYGPSKYRDIVRAMQWARHMRRQDEYRNEPMAELIEKALLGVVSGEVTPEQVDEAVKQDQAIAEKIDAKRERPGAPAGADEDKPKSRK